MERMLSVEQVAEILGLRPFTVRKMFREGRLRGFKVGKAWRISERNLAAEIARLESGAAEQIREVLPDKAAAPVPSVPFQTRPALDAAVHPAAAPPPAPPIPSGTPAFPPVPRCTDRLIVFSAVSGQEVILDGESKGMTTLSILDVPEGEHRLQVGDTRGVIQLSRDTELRVTAEGGVFQHSTRGLARPGSLTRLRLRVENQSAFKGELLVVAASEGGEGTGEVFREYRDYLGLGGLELRHTVPGEGAFTWFDGPVRTNPGTRLLIQVPRQPGIDREVVQGFPLEAPLFAVIELTVTGLLRARPMVRIRRETEKG